MIAPGGAKTTLSVEVARTPEEQERGLMFRSSVTHGMIFVFDRPQPLSFWMKNTLVPLDIVYFAADGSYVSSATMQPCTADPCPTYPSGADAAFALEMPEGFVKQKGIGSGWKLEGKGLME